MKGGKTLLVGVAATAAVATTTTTTSSTTTTASSASTSLATSSNKNKRPTPSPSPTPAPTPTPTPTTAVTVPAGYTIKLAVGVKCDGVTDDTSAIQSNLYKLAPYQALQLPAGTCVTSNNVILGPGKSNMMIFGAGKDSTIIKALNPQNSAVVLTQDSNIILQGFQVFSANATGRTGNGSTDGIYIEKSSNVMVDNVKVKQVSGAGIMIWTVNGATIQNSVVDHSLADGFHVTAGSQNITLQNNVANAVGDDAFASIGYGTGLNKNISILNNMAQDGAWAGGIGIEGTTGAKIYGNKIYRSGIAGIRVDSQSSYSTGPSSQIDIQNNYLEGNVTRTNTGHGAIMIYVDWSNGYVQGITGSGNKIVSPANGLGVRAYGYSAANNVQGSLLNTSMTGVTTSYSIGSYASVAH